MNKFLGSGRLVRNAIVNGREHKALKFSIAAKYGYNSKAKKELIEFVPCVLFNPSHMMETFLSSEGQGVHVEFEGRVSTSKYEKNGEPRFDTIVIVDKRTFNLVTKPKQ